MKRLSTLAALVFLFGCTSPDSGSETTSDIASPYTGQETRDIKALSTQEVDDYLAGRGLGFAKVAELNHYPGPRHVLDAVDRIELTVDQQQRVKTLFDGMQQEAQELGRQIVDLEGQLDRMFAMDEADEEAVQSLIENIGARNARLRYVHVRTHLEMKRILTPEQVKRYDALRGYGEGVEHVHTKGMVPGV